MKYYILAKQHMNTAVKNIVENHPYLTWLLLFIGAPLSIVAAVTFCAYIVGSLFILLSSL